MSDLKRFFLFMILSLVVLSCNDDEEEDLAAPRIDVNSPQNGQKFDAGGYIPFEALFSDNRSLATFSIDIHNAFDGHGHGRIAEDPNLIKFSYGENFALPGETAHLVTMPEEIEVPENTMAGPYHFIVQAIDAEGNATSYQDGSIIEHEILIINGSMAIISITNMINGELEIEADVPFFVEGSITDPPHQELSGIEEVVFILREPEGDHSHARKAESLFERVLMGSDLDPYYNQDGSLNISGMVDFTLTGQEISALLAEGTDHLELIVEAHDLQGNISIELVPVHIHTD
jgi:hypothetical protein